MSGLEYNRLLPIVIVLSIGLVGTTSLYINELSAGDEPPYDPGVVDGLVEDLDEANSEITRLGEMANELGKRVEELESVPPTIMVEKSVVTLREPGEGSIENVILLIGDGMGIGQLTAAEVMNGEKSLAITSLPYMSMVSTHSSSSLVTDSAASATALASGYKTRNGRVAVDAEGEVLFTVLEDAEEIGKATGIVTTTRVTHATPACFFSHVINRDMEANIAEQLLSSGLDVALGGGSTYFDSLRPEEMGYTVVVDSSGLEEIESGMVLGLFSSGHMDYTNNRNGTTQPSLSEMTKKSLELLSKDPDGFFLVVEGGRIDHASHDNNFTNTITETLEFDLAVIEALEFAAGRNDTLVVVTADHETGGLSIVGGYQTSGLQVEWVTDDHIGSMVPVYAYGPRASEVTSFTDNTDVGEFLLAVID